MRWFKEIVEAHQKETRTAAQEHTPPYATAFEQKRQQPARPSARYASVSPPSSLHAWPSGDTSVGSRAERWLDDVPVPWAGDASTSRADVSELVGRSARSYGTLVDDDEPPGPPQERTLRFDPDHRLVSYPVAEAPARPELIHKRRRRD